MGGKQALSGVEIGQILAYKKEGLSSREIARRIDRSPFVVNNFLKLGNTYGPKKSYGRPRKITPRQERKVIRQLRAGRTSLGKLAQYPNIQVYQSALS
jgi:Transposase and inactivated derivatives